MQLSKIKPGAGNSHCVAFGDVLGILLLVFSWVPGVAALHDCAVLSKNAVEGDSRRKDTENLKHLGLPVTLASRHQHGICRLGSLFQFSWVYFQSPYIFQLSY